MKKILILASNPKETHNLDLDREIREIRQGLRQLSNRDEYDIETRGAVRPVDLRRAMLEVDPHIVHFCGHGNGEDGLFLEDDKGQSRPVSSDALAKLFAVFEQQVECIILNACYSEIQADALVQHINYVVGMKQEIPDEAAIAFSLGFYEAIGANRSIEEAYQLGCSAIQMDFEEANHSGNRKFIPIYEPGERPDQTMLSHLMPVLKKKKEFSTIAPKVTSQQSNTTQYSSIIGHSS